MLSSNFDDDSPAAGGGDDDDNDDSDGSVSFSFVGTDCCSLLCSFSTIVPPHSFSNLCENCRGVKPLAFAETNRWRILEKEEEEQKGLINVYLLPFYFSKGLQIFGDDNNKKNKKGLPVIS